MKTKKKLVWHLFIPYLAVILVTLIATTWYASTALRQFHLDHTQTDLKNRAYLAKQQILNLFTLSDLTPLKEFCEEAGRQTSTRITVILPTGQVLADSFENAAAMENHGDRPEIITALNGKTGTAIRYSETLTQSMMYVALPIDPNGNIKGVIRASIPLTAIEKNLFSIRLNLIIWGGVIALLAAAISLWLARRISLPILTLRNGAERFAKGEFSQHLPIPDSREIADLTQTMNDMAVQLSDRVTTIMNQRNELEAVLSSMLEGVVALNTAGSIIKLNSAAAEIFDTTPENTEHKSFMEISRNYQLQEFVQQAMDSDAPINRDIVVFNKAIDQFYNVHSTPILDDRDVRSGTLIVLNDVTKIKRLEKVRQDFVANVSHEIKTPLTAIKGFVETLRYGSLDDIDETHRFLGIIERHVNRLTAILEDLLVLSRLEQQGEQQGIDRKPSSLKSVIQTAAQVCQSGADEKKISLEIKCPENMLADIDETLMEQALINLIDNAIKYSNPNRPIQIEANTSNNWITITIRDHGCGIPTKHIPRIFERFYRVDKARSRGMGGTGLGLSIVKHIVNSHGGNITVKSTPGKGSTFSIQLPRHDIER